MLAEAAFVPNTPISSSAVNSDLSDIAAGLTNTVTKDGQTAITAPIRFASGSVGLPAIAFVADPDCGIYRIGANNIGVSVNATKILDIATTGLSVTGTVAPSTTVTNANGTVLLPSYTFAGDLNSGMYWIGADNIGVAVNATKILDISASGLNVVGTISSNGAALAPLAQGAGMVNGIITVTENSPAGNAMTIAVKTLAGNDPSAGDPVFCVFRNVTPGTGNYTIIQLTAALSLVVTSGSTLGTTSNIPFRLWFALFNDGGTVRLGVINCLSGTDIYPLGQFPVASSTAEGGAGGADSAQVFYTGSAVSSKAYQVIGYAGYESGLGTAGAWASAPTRIHLYGDGVPLPGAVIQTRVTATGATADGTTTIAIDDNIPQNTAGTEFMSQAITPTSACDILEIEFQLNAAVSGGNKFCTSALFQDAGANSLAAVSSFTGTANTLTQNHGKHRKLAATTSSTTLKVRAGGDTASTVTFNGLSSARKFGGVMNSYLSVRQIMA